MPTIRLYVRARDWDSREFRHLFEADLHRSGWLLRELDPPAITQGDPVYVVTVERGASPPDTARRWRVSCRVCASEDLYDGHALAARRDAVPIGLFFRAESAPRYDLYTARGLEMPSDQRLAALERELDRFAVSAG